MESSNNKIHNFRHNQHSKRRKKHHHYSNLNKNSKFHLRSKNKNEEKNCKDYKYLKIALAGNPNVGKSVIFNKLTGMSQVIGNWPGKTVSKAEGRALFGEYMFNIIDLPGIYSLSTYSLEEIISREFIVGEKPDFIINVIDSNHLERNLFFTLQLLMLGRPVIISLNQYDLLEKRGYKIDIQKLSEILGVPVVPTIAVHNRGVHEILEGIIEMHEDKDPYVPKIFEFGKEIEEKVLAIEELFQIQFPNHDYTPRFASLKIIENDKECIENLGLENDKEKNLLIQAKKARDDLEEMHGEQISTVLNAELFNIANNISKHVEILEKRTQKQKINFFIDHITIHSVFGYFILAAILFGCYFTIFNIGGWISGLIDSMVELWTPNAAEFLGGEDSLMFIIIWNGLFGGLMGGIGGVLPFVCIFFFFIEVLQDVGYLPRAAYLMDRFLEKIGVHGKTIIPILLGFGCNVPAVTAASIMETEKEKRRAILISSMVPCSAVATIVMGLVGKHLGIEYALILYAVSFTSIIIVGRILASSDIATESELIIELHDFRKPNFKVIAKQTWHRSKEFVYLALPLIVIISGLMEIFVQFNLLTPVNTMLSPITVGFLGLPIGIGVYFIYGILRKELNLVLLELYVTVSLGISMTDYMTSIQMIVFCTITMIYVPCVAVIITIKKESGTRYAIFICILEIILAIIIGGAIRWINVIILMLLPELPDSMAIFLTFIVFFIIVGFGLSITTSVIGNKNHMDRKKHSRPNLIKKSQCIENSCQGSKKCGHCGFNTRE